LRLHAYQLRSIARLAGTRQQCCSAGFFRVIGNDQKMLFALIESGRYNAINLPHVVFERGALFRTQCLVDVDDDIADVHFVTPFIALWEWLQVQQAVGQA